MTVPTPRSRTATGGLGALLEFGEVDAGEPADLLAETQLADEGADAIRHRASSESGGSLVR